MAIDHIVAIDRWSCDSNTDAISVRQTKGQCRSGSAANDGLGLPQSLRSKTGFTINILDSTSCRSEAGRLAKSRQIGKRREPTIGHSNIHKDAAASRI